MRGCEDSMGLSAARIAYDGKGRTRRETYEPHEESKQWREVPLRAEEVSPRVKNTLEVSLKSQRHTTVCA